jgi:hypothetical protein
MRSLKDFQAQLEASIYGKTPEGHCVSCKAPFSEINVHTAAGWRETKLSKLCEDCWDKEFK